MNLAVIGAGNIGGTLGKRWAAQGHTVFFGVRDPGAQKVQALLVETEGEATAVSVAEAIAAADVVLLAVPGKAVDDTIAAHHEALDGKIIIDATNKVGAEQMYTLELYRAHTPQASLFRAFNTLGWENFANPTLDGTQIDLFYCGDGGEAQQMVDSLIADVGLRPIYLGGAEQIELLDGLTRLWFTLAMQRGYGRRLAFKMLTA